MAQSDQGQAAASSELTGGPLRRLVVPQLSVENRYSGASNSETGYERPNSRDPLKATQETVQAELI